MIPILDAGRGPGSITPQSRFHTSRAAAFCAAGLMLLCVCSDPALAEAPRVLPQGDLPNNSRLQPLKDLDGYFPFTVSPTPEAWSKRAEQVRRQIQVATGLFPPPPKTPLNPVIHGKIDRDSYTVEKVYFESVPGFFVTGNLYRPKGKAAPFPGVLCPHGHWDNGRFMDYGPERVRQEIVQGAERFEEGGRSVLQARCVQLARMGCVVFHYDMIGYADSQQISFDLAHRFAQQRPEMNTTADWGLFSPQAEAHLQSIMGLQTWNSVRALDFLRELPGVDSQRIAVTGASGGGTQTFIVCALDSRPALAFPAVMVSTAMQGGCTCENASLLRVDTGNVEFAALFAPKPLGMTAANDWTKEMPSKGFPQLKQHYAMLGASQNVMLKPLIHFEHNYNYVSRAAMYSWVNKHFNLGLAEPVLEQDYQRLTQDEMSVWDDQHPRPESGPEFERKLLRWLTTDADRQLKQASASLEQWRNTAGKAMDVVLGRTLDETGPVTFQTVATDERQEFTQVSGLLRNTEHYEELPVVILQPKKRAGRTVVWAHANGKAGLFRADGGPAQPKAEIQKLLAAGFEVVGVDLLYQGEFQRDGNPLARAPLVKNPRQAAAYTFGYNRAVFAERVHDLLTVVRFLQGRDPKPQAIDLAGLDSTGPLVAAARAQAPGAIDRAAVFIGGFRFGSVLEIQDPNFLPGGAKYGDIPGLLALGAPGKLWLAGEGDHAPELVQACYRKAEADRNLTLSSAAASEAESDAVAWVIQWDRKGPTD